MSGADGSRDNHIDNGVLLAEIKSRGHWHVVIRPVEFLAELLERLEIGDIVDGCAVNLRGWDYPHVGHEEPRHIDVDWVGQATRWEHHREFWRMYRSGQFVSVSGIPYDWRDQSGWWPADDKWAANKLLGVKEVIARLTEVTESASRLCQTKAGSKTMKIKVSLGRMQGRALFVDSSRRSGLSMNYRAAVETIPVERVVSCVELVQNGRGLATALAEEVFSFFGWKPAPNIAADVQNEFLKGL
jgi:hypothetical protein